MWHGGALKKVLEIWDCLKNFRYHDWKKGVFYHEE